MFWADKIANDSQGFQIVNDSKTPSGRVHVGSLRGVIIHDVIYRALQQSAKPAKFLYGVDDFDPLDTVPRYLSREKFLPYLGVPLCNVPSPEEFASDYAKYFMQEFLEVFDYLGVEPEVYYVRDIYRSGKFNSSIDAFLKNASIVREVYKEVSKADRPDDWYPFQVICENCGKIATTSVTSYNGSEVFYTCKQDAVNWVQGCGHSGWISPFDGHGKLPWKLEWVAKWDLFGVTIEMAGKDHSQKGGSRDVANALFQRVFGKQAPYHSHYEFILVDGTKMSSSKGIGFSAKDVANLLPPELLRFLMLRTRPKTVINFSPNYETITRLFRDYDSLLNKYQALLPLQGEATLPEDLMPLLYSQTDGIIKPYHLPELGTFISLLQIPHLNIREEVKKRVSHPLTGFEQKALEDRIRVSQKWLENYADPEEKLILYLDQAPNESKHLLPEQVSYLRHLLNHLKITTAWEDENLQTILFSTAKELGLQVSLAFQAIYLCFLGKERGPRAGSLLSYLDKSFVLDRLDNVTQDNLH